MPSTRTLSLLAALVVLASAQTIPAAGSKGNPEAGKKLYLESCKHCHGVTGKAETELAGSLTTRPADLTSEKMQSKTDGQLRKAIVEGVAGTPMSHFGKEFDDSQMADLISYIRSLKP